MLRRVEAALVATLATGPALALAADPDDESELDQIVVTSTRTPTMIRDAPLRIEAVPAEEIEENLTIQPGNVSALLKELPGVRVQSSAPGLGGADMRLRGFAGRYTLVLADGLPLLGIEPDAFGLLQTQPLDLARAEVIKGAVSALYGGSALGGVLNLVSQTPDAESSFLVNATSRGGQDLVAFLTGRSASRWSGTVTAGAHHQARDDPDHDGWADLAGYRRYTLRPRLWWDGGPGRSVFLTAGVVDEDRRGGTLPGRTLPAGEPFAEQLQTRRYDLGAIAHWAIHDASAFSGRFSLTSNRLDRSFGLEHTPSTATTVFAEGAWSGTRGEHRWVAGLAFARDELAVSAAPGVSYASNTPAAFAQDEFAATPWLTLAGSARVDANSRYGTFLSPRLSALWRAPQSEWSLRASIGGGFAAPTPFVDEIEETGLGVLLPLSNLHAERAVTASLDAKWADEGWDVNASLYFAEIRNPLEVRAAGTQQVELVNAPGPWRAPGAEVLIGYVNGPLHLIAAWSYLDVTEIGAAGVREDAPLVPRETASLDGILESEKRGRIGLELDYIGRQTLADDPYRGEGRAHFEINALAELRFGRFAVFLNAINLTNVRQTRYDPLIRPTPGLGGNPITEVWAPLVGRTFNLGVRAEL